MRKIFFLLILLLSIPSVLGYIDPGTGGYLISVLWQYIVAFFAFVSASVIFFFKHKIPMWWKNKWVKITVFAFGTIIIATILFFLLQPGESGGLV